MAGDTLTMLPGSDNPFPLTAFKEARMSYSTKWKRVVFVVLPLLVFPALGCGAVKWEGELIVRSSSA